MNAFERTMFSVATNLTPQLCLVPGSHIVHPVPSKLAVLVAMVSITLLAHSGRVTAQTYDWTSLSEKQLTSFSNNAELSVAISGDIAVVGDRNVSSLAGEVKLFQRVSDGNWNPLATFTASDATAGDRFGHAVGISGDTVVVGAWQDDDGGSSSGSAYVFTKPGSGWATTSTHAAKLTASDAYINDYFGYSVGISGDTVVVGAHANDDNGVASGSAYVFTKPGGGWASSTEDAKLTASDADSSDYLGQSVGISGETVVVGAWGDDDSENGTGSAYLFTRSGTTWSQAAKLTASDATAYDYFGSSVGISGDSVVVGARYDDDGGSQSGSAYLFTKPGSGWATTSTHAAKLTASDPSINDRLGHSVGISGDTVVVGAYGDDGIGSDSGSAYVFTKPGSGWATTSTHAAKLTASDAAASDNFGRFVGIDAASGRVIVGNYPDAGSATAYIYEAAVPEPSTALLLCLGLMALATGRWNRRLAAIGAPHRAAWARSVH